MKRFFVGSFAYVVAAVAVFNTSSVAKAEIDGLQIRFKGGCVEENLSGRCSIAIRASGFDFSTADRVTLYVSAGRNQPMRRMTNHWRQLNERGQTIANIKNVPGACFQVRTWTDRDDASVRFRQQGRYANSRRAARSAYDEFDTTDRRDGIDRSYSSRDSEGNNRDISSNVVCEPSQQMAGTSSPSCDSLGGF